MIDLTTTYLGLETAKSRCRFLLAHSRRKWARSGKLEDAGASAVVLHSLFEEQITLESQELDRYLTEGDGELCRVAHLFSGHDVV